MRHRITKRFLMSLAALAMLTLSTHWLMCWLYSYAVMNPEESSGSQAIWALVSLGAAYLAAVTAVSMWFISGNVKVATEALRIKGAQE